MGHKVVYFTYECWKICKIDNREEAQSLNILYIHTHDSGRVLGPYGYAVPTPNLEAFAKQAAVFQKLLLCGTDLFSQPGGDAESGTYPHQNGMLGLAQRIFHGL